MNILLFMFQTKTKKLLSRHIIIGNLGLKIILFLDIAKSGCLEQWYQMVHILYYKVKEYIDDCGTSVGKMRVQAFRHKTCRYIFRNRLLLFILCYAQSLRNFCVSIVFFFNFVTDRLMDRIN